MGQLHGPVLAAIDLDDAADDVLRQAHDLATALEAPLRVCHVLHEALRARMLFPQFTQFDVEAEMALERKAREAIETRVTEVTGRHVGEFDIVLETGSPRAGLLDAVERIGAGVLVVGAGGVAIGVARYAPCTILVVRPSPRGAVLAATDFSDPSLPAIETAVGEARRRRAALRLVHCVEFGEPILLGSSRFAIGLVPALPGELADELAASAKQRLEDSLVRFDATGECLVRRGGAAFLILQAAREVPTALLVIGKRGRSNLSRLLLGSVAESVLHDAPCSVLLVQVHSRHAAAA